MVSRGGKCSVEVRESAESSGVACGISIGASTGHGIWTRPRSASGATFEGPLKLDA